MGHDVGGATVVLSDGRLIGVRQRGEPHGSPVFWFHGRPGWCPDLGGDLDALLSDLGVRLIEVDRPGFGASDPCPGRRVCEWPADVAQVADFLTLDRFAVAGYCAGGPYAAACAALLPGRVSAYAIVAGAGRSDTAGYTAGMGRRERALQRRARWSQRLVTWSIARAARSLRRHPERYFRALDRDLQAPDRETLRAPGARERFTRALFASLRQGGACVAEDLAAVSGRPWGFRPADARAPGTILFGDCDGVVPPTHGRNWATLLPAARVIEVRGLGHAVAPDRLAALLAGLIASPDASLRTRSQAPGRYFTLSSPAMPPSR